MNLTKRYVPRMLVIKREVQVSLRSCYPISYLISYISGLFLERYFDTELNKHYPDFCDLKTKSIFPV